MTLLTDLTQPETPLSKQWYADCARMALQWSEPQLGQLGQFYDYLMEINAHTNLTRIETPEAFLYRHVLDSLHLSAFIASNASLADIGSGGGFPAIPLAIYRPDIQITAIESVGKKAQFMTAVAKRLKLKNLTVACERCEMLGQASHFRATKDYVTARALAPLPVLLELSLAMLKNPKPETGYFAQLLALKGSKFEEELAASTQALETLNARLQSVIPHPIEALSHSVVAVFEKINPTPRQYPRSAGTPKKLPL